LWQLWITIFTIAESMLGVVVVKARTLDDSSNIRPSMEIFVAHPAKWLERIQGVPRVDRPKILKEQRRLAT
jgi:hypothetical protein